MQCALCILSRFLKITSQSPFKQITVETPVAGVCSPVMLQFKFTFYHVHPSDIHSSGALLYLPQLGEFHPPQAEVLELKLGELN